MLLLKTENDSLIECYFQRLKMTLELKVTLKAENDYSIEGYF